MTAHSCVMREEQFSTIMPTGTEINLTLKAAAASSSRCQRENDLVAPIKLFCFIHLFIHQHEIQMDNIRVASIKYPLVSFLVNTIAEQCIMFS